ncbi:hypothetical protein ACFV4G_28910, partial [Kitasatospora sp. NPDC059747]|uniref:hypothetical protein n=1 Tax=Kitasatospora sp. NPDC059747 TaxID=3346930 RepID=UPI0036650314
MTTTSIHRQLTAWIESEDFSCLGAKAALRRESLRPIQVGPMGEAATTEALHDALGVFVTYHLRRDQTTAGIGAGVVGRGG